MAFADDTSAGIFRVNTTTTGAFTGELTYLDASYRVKGSFDVAGAATVSIPRENESALLLTLQTSTSSALKISGTLSDGVITATLSGTGVLEEGRVASPYAGRWTILLPAAAEQATETIAPVGTSYATMLVNRNGSARILGRLADGSAFSFGAQIDGSGHLSLDVPLYRHQGALTGILQFTTSTDAGNLVNGSAQWFKPADLPRQKYYPEGFTLELEAAGSPYATPQAASSHRASQSQI
jgi:hypothetical protein